MSVLKNRMLNRIPRLKREEVAGGWRTLNNEELRNCSLQQMLRRSNEDPCHHGMARPWVADGGNGLQIWRVAENILKKQLRAADKG
jgi:hypothetical protein